uniref:Secreted protein n=1 Tax=Utricularia reniformis TaxID=192314 RepID=A0A1Y0B1I5_9LAMI|nr:hypothetical protein AEK19_MT1057 [Utricularia reniformis]ART31280.1 hypothetical protein AEK19_MT1057 [Utricularia reniformis]
MKVKIMMVYLTTSFFRCLGITDCCFRASSEAVLEMVSRTLVDLKNPSTRSIHSIFSLWRQRGARLAFTSSDVRM